MTKQELEVVLQEPALVAVLQTTEWSADQALVVLRAQRQSGLSVQEFSRRVGIVSWRLYRWRLRLQAQLADEPPVHASVCAAPLPAPFVPLPVPTAPTPQESEPLRSACAEFLHPSGVRVRLTAATPPAWLPVLCQALGTSC